MSNDNVYFVWTVSNGNRRPEIWYEPLVGIPLKANTGAPLEPPLFCTRLDEFDRRLSLQELARKYPLPEKSECTRAVKYQIAENPQST